MLGQHVRCEGRSGLASGQAVLFTPDLCESDKRESWGLSPGWPREFAVPTSLLVGAVVVMEPCSCCCPAGAWHGEHPWEQTAWKQADCLGSSCSQQSCTLRVCCLKLKHSWRYCLSWGGNSDSHLVVPKWNIYFPHCSYLNCDYRKHFSDMNEAFLFIWGSWRPNHRRQVIKLSVSQQEKDTIYSKEKWASFFLLKA